MTTRKTFLGRAGSASGLLVLGPEKLWAAVRRPTLKEAVADGEWHIYRYRRNEDALGWDGRPGWYDQASVDGVMIATMSNGMIDLPDTPSGSVDQYEWDPEYGCQGEDPWHILRIRLRR